MYMSYMCICNQLMKISCLFRVNLTSGFPRTSQSVITWSTCRPFNIPRKRKNSLVLHVDLFSNFSVKLLTTWNAYYPACMDDLKESIILYRTSSWRAFRYSQRLSIWMAPPPFELLELMYRMLPVCQLLKEPFSFSLQKYPFSSSLKRAGGHVE